MAEAGDASRLLTELAARAQTQPGALGAGRFDYVRTRGWYLDLEIGPGGRVAGQIDLTEREQWIAVDGSGRIEEFRSGRRTETSGEYRPGGLFGPQQLATDPAELARQLTGCYRPGESRDWLHVLARVWAVQVVFPRLQAALLRILADTRDVTDRGAVTDRIGRRGVAVAGRPDHRGLPARYTLILDPGTGMLLAADQTIVSAGSLPVTAPASVSYTAWLQTGRVDSTQTRP